MLHQTTKPDASSTLLTPTPTSARTVIQTLGRALARTFALTLTLAVTAGCGRPAPPPPADLGGGGDTLAGIWRAELASPGGPLPFTLRFTDTPEGLAATVINRDEAAPASGVEVRDEAVVVRFDVYDAEITASLDPTHAHMVGTWRRTGEGGIDSTLAFSASRGDSGRFRPRSEGTLAAAQRALASVAGVWATTFSDEDGDEVARGELSQDGARVTGTFLTPTGDYRFLDGSFEDDLLRLSTFDGAHAFLFHARAQPDGTLRGDFWSRDTYHATWVAHRARDGESILPDPWSEVSLTNDQGRFRFAFPDLDGHTVTESDPRFAGKAMLINIFGTWCPNCNDEAPLLAAWDRRYRDRGLAIVGLAFEFTDDLERDRRQLERFATRHAIDYPLLLAAGTSDKADAAEALPDLDRIVAYPTSVFVGRDGIVRRIHSGFAGPGTGAHFDALIAELEALIESMLEATAPGG